MPLPKRFQLSRANRSSVVLWTETSFFVKNPILSLGFPDCSGLQFSLPCLVGKTQLWSIASRKKKLGTDRNASEINATFWKKMQFVIRFLVSSCFPDF